MLAVGKFRIAFRTENMRPDFVREAHSMMDMHSSQWQSPYYAKEEENQPSLVCQYTAQLNYLI